MSYMRLASDSRGGQHVTRPKAKALPPTPFMPAPHPTSDQPHVRPLVALIKDMLARAQTLRRLTKL